MKHIRAFTLVELIVVVTILAILGTIGFISLQGYSANARDSVRISDLRNIERSLELYHLGNGSYPSASTGSVISYSGSELWTQGTFDDSLTLKVGKIHPKPTDPLTGSEYVYSVTYSKQEYQIAGALERGNPVGLTSETYADYNQAVVSGKYNGSIIGKTIGSDTYIFGVPSIIALTEADIEIQDIIAQDKFVLNKYSAIPKGLETAEISSNRTVSFTPSAHTDGILFQGSSESLASQSGSLELAQSLYDYYQGSSIAEADAIVSFTQSDPSITVNEVQASNSASTLLASMSLIEAASIQAVVPVAMNSCDLPWGGSISHGETASAYQASSVSYGNNCVSETRTCNDGTLSGSYTASTCSVASVSNLSLQHTNGTNIFTASWTGAGSGISNCVIQNYDGSIWQTIQTVDCNANATNQSFTLVNVGSSWNGRQVRLAANSGSTPLAVFPETLQCSATNFSGTPTPSIDEDCDGNWNNFAHIMQAGCNEGYYCGKLNRYEYTTMCEVLISEGRETCFPEYSGTRSFGTCGVPFFSTSHGTSIRTIMFEGTECTSVAEARYY